MNVLVLGSGGREHALAWRISKCNNLNNLYCLPGNPGTAAFATNIDGSVSDFQLINSEIEKKEIGLVVVGPENPLVDGIVDFLHERQPDLLIIGPDKKGAQLEGSKEYAKKFMNKYGIPTAAYHSFTKSTEAEAFSFLESLKPPYVLKADGLAAGKGVIITNGLDEAKSELHSMFEGKFGSAGGCVVIEEFLSGIELSVFVLTDGKDYLILPEAKDYKRIGDHDTGLNTGGMGSVSPVPFADEAFMKKVEERIVKPTIKGISQEDMNYRGFIFIGLMNCGGDPYVIEYNVRMGDPETESVMMRIGSDFLQHLVAAASGTIGSETLETRPETAVTVVAVSKGYPESYQKGFPIQFSRQNLPDDCMIFHAGTKNVNGTIVTSGGRVLTATVCGSSISEAKDKAYNLLSTISFDGMYYRSDITDDVNRLN